MNGPRGRIGAGVALLALAAMAVLSPWPPADAAAAGPQLEARAWVLIDAADGERLAAHRPHRSYPVASATKLMTAYVARRALALDEVVVAPAYAASAAESLVGLQPGERIAVRDLLYGLLLASGNDAAVALAVATAGSVPAFVKRMNRAAARLGLEGTAYANPIGLDEPGSFATAADLVALARELRRDPTFRRIFDAPEAVLESGIESRTVVNRNDLVRTVAWVNGVKTGYTLGAGNVLVASATRKGVTLISAVLGAPSEAARDAETLELLAYGFSRYRVERPLRRGELLASAALRWQDESLGLAAARPVRVTVRRGQQIDTEVDAPAEVEGPVDRGDRLGTAVVTVDGERTARVALVAARAAPAASLGDRVDAAIPGPRLAAWLGLAIVAAAGLIAVMRLLRHRRRAP